MSKSPTSTAIHGRPTATLTASIAKALSTSDEFKHGFPSGGLSTASNRWWGTRSPGGGGAEIAASPEREEEEKSGASLLRAARAMAVEEGRGVVKLGVRSGKVGKRQRALLRRVFGSSLVKDWLTE